MMKLVINPTADELEVLLARPVMAMKSIKKIVKPILKKVKQKGDAALYKYALEYDHVEIKELIVSEEEIENAEELLDNDLKIAIQQAQRNIEKFHALQRQKELVVDTLPGVTCKRKSVPITRVGLYIPGGTAPLFSTALMLGIPAKLAGCREIVLCTPPKKDGKIPAAILYAAHLIGIDRIIKAGARPLPRWLMARNRCQKCIKSLALGISSWQRPSKLYRKKASPSICQPGLRKWPCTPMKPPYHRSWQQTCFLKPNTGPIARCCW